MTLPKTLLQMAGANLEPAKLDDASLIIVDMQCEYMEGPVAVTNFEAAIGSAQELLEKTRNSGAPIYHIAHKGRAGSLFDRDAWRGQIVDALAPLEDENLVEKGLPNAFAGTGLHDLLAANGRKELIICGFMTHMCVSSTARAALDLGYRVTINAEACATRDLPDGRGGVVPAEIMNDMALVGLADRFAIIARDHKWQL